MIFGRKRKPARAIEEPEEVETDETGIDDEPADPDAGDPDGTTDVVDTDDDEGDSGEDSDDDAADSDADSDEEGDSDEDEGDEEDDDSEDEDGDEEDDDSEDEDEEDEEDDPVDYREDGPFDFDEVDLDADDIERIDFGALIITPFENMELQLQVDQGSQQIQSALVVHEGSGIEVALFAAPKNGGLAKEVLAELVEITQESGGQAEIEDGPFGPELFRVVTVSTPEAQNMLHRSRIWLVEGPRWMLRAVLMGNAVEAGPGRELLEDFFRNLVVVRGSEAKARGDLITLTMPKNLVAG